MAFGDWGRRVDYRAKGGSKVCPLGLGMDEPRLGRASIDEKMK